MEVLELCSPHHFHHSKHIICPDLQKGTAHIPTWRAWLVHSAGGHLLIGSGMYVAGFTVLGTYDPGWWRDRHSTTYRKNQPATAQLHSTSVCPHPHSAVTRVCPGQHCCTSDRTSQTQWVDRRYHGLFSPCFLCLAHVWLSLLWSLASLRVFCAAQPCSSQRDSFYCLLWLRGA